MVARCLHLSTPSSFEPIQLITQDEHDNEPYMANIMGWGNIYYNGPTSNVLLEVYIPIDDECGNYSDSQITENHMCAGDSDGGDGGSSGKVVCTMMNERYGFGSFRNKIWMKFHEHHGPEYQKGYHAIFLPLVKIAKGEGKINTAVRKVLEHMGRHVTADMFKIMKGKKRDTLGRIYRAIFEPACHIIGKIKSALGRG